MIFLQLRLCHSSPKSGSPLPSGWSSALKHCKEHSSRLSILHSLPTAKLQMLFGTTCPSLEPFYASVDLHMLFPLLGIPLPLYTPGSLADSHLPFKHSAWRSPPLSCLGWAALLVASISWGLFMSHQSCQFFYCLLYQPKVPRAGLVMFPD